MGGVRSCFGAFRRPLLRLTKVRVAQCRRLLFFPLPPPSSFCILSCAPSLLVSSSPLFPLFLFPRFFSLFLRLLAPLASPSSFPPQSGPLLSLISPLSSFPLLSVFLPSFSPRSFVFFLLSFFYVSSIFLLSFFYVASSSLLFSPSSFCLLLPFFLFLLSPLFCLLSSSPLSSYFSCFFGPIFLQAGADAPPA